MHIQWRSYGQNIGKRGWKKCMAGKQGISYVRHKLSSKHYPLSLWLKHGSSLVFGSIAPHYLILLAFLFLALFASFLSLLFIFLCHSLLVLILGRPSLCILTLSPFDIIYIWRVFALILAVVPLLWRVFALIFQCMHPLIASWEGVLYAQ